MVNAKRSRAAAPKKRYPESAEVNTWVTDCKRGRQEAAALIAKMRHADNPLLLRAKLAHLGDFNSDGVANGFTQEIAERLILEGRR